MLKELLKIWEPNPSQNIHHEIENLPQKLQRSLKFLKKIAPNSPTGDTKQDN